MNIQKMISKTIYKSDLVLCCDEDVKAYCDSLAKRINDDLIEGIVNSEIDSTLPNHSHEGKGAVISRIKAVRKLWFLFPEDAVGSGRDGSPIVALKEAKDFVDSHWK